MLKEEDLAAWFADAGIAIPFSLDDLPDETPHRAHAIDVSGDLGFTLEQAFERPQFQLLTRGVNGKDARDLHKAANDVWINANPGFYIGDYWVVDKGRSAGPAQGSKVATDDRKRVLRAATYWAEIAR